MIGAQGCDPALGVFESDVVGNVFVKTDSSSLGFSRIGFDGTGNSFGKYRFVSNTWYGNNTQVRLSHAKLTTLRALVLLLGVQCILLHSTTTFSLGNIVFIRINITVVALQYCLIYPLVIIPVCSHHCQSYCRTSSCNVWFKQLCWILF